jgi:hypothetical protein
MRFRLVGIALLPAGLALLPAGLALLPVGLALLLGACAGGPTPPDWQISAQLGINAFEKAYLAGNTGVAEAEFARARRELSATGREIGRAHV